MVFITLEILILKNFYFILLYQKVFFQVLGPGNAPSNIRLNSVRPRTIHIYWDPSTIPNGNITRYIVYYTPLDDQVRLILQNFE